MPQDRQEPSARPLPDDPGGDDRPAAGVVSEHDLPQGAAHPDLAAAGERSAADNGPDATRNLPRVAGREPTGAPPRPPSRDPRTALVVVAALLVVLAVALVGFWLLPGPVEQGVTDLRGVYIVAIASAALTAVGTMVAAYVGVKAATVAREDAERAWLRHEIRVAALAGAAPSAAAYEANREASEQIRELGL
jgi:hypothetical protein